MTGEELFHFIHALDRREKAYFTKTSIRYKAENSDYYLLYRAIEALDSFNEKSIRSNNDFYNSQKYNNARRKLASKIMDSLVTASDDPVPFKNYVLIAIRKGATSLAQKKVIEEVKNALLNNDWIFLNFIKRFIDEIKYATGIHLLLGNSIEDENIIESMTSDTQRLRKLLFGLREATLLPENNTSLQLKRISQEIDSFPHSQGLNGYLILKAKAVLERIMNGHSCAQKKFKEVVSYLETSSFPLQQGYLLKELSLLAILNCHIGNLEESFTTILKLSTIAPNDPTFADRKMRLMCKVQLSPSISQISLDIPHKGYAILQANPGLFSKLEYSALQLSYTLVLFIHDRHEACKNILRELRNSPKAHWKPIEWTIELSYFLALLGSNSHDASEIQLKKLELLAKNTSLKIPTILYQFLSKIHFSSKTELKQHWDSIHPEIESCLSDYKERVLYERFNLPAWVESTISGKPLQQLYFLPSNSEGSNMLHFG